MRQKCINQNSKLKFILGLVRIDLTDYALLHNGLVSVQNTYSSFLRSTTEYNFVIGFKIDKKQFRVGECWNITSICTKHVKIR